MHHNRFDTIIGAADNRGRKPKDCSYDCKASELEQQSWLHPLSGSLVERVIIEGLRHKRLRHEQTTTKTYGWGMSIFDVLSHFWLCGF
eukprot:3106563-Amphidinium_carterae.1